MPHSVYTRNLGRSRSWRKATVQALAQALLRHERIETTLARAKEAQRLAERLITLGKDGSLSARRHAIRLLNDPRLVARLFSEVAPRFSQRPGGYTRIVHSGWRPGDGASMAVLELVERPAVKQPKQPPKGRAQRRPAPPAAAPPERQEEPPPRKQKPAPEAKKEEPKKPGEKPKTFLDGLRQFFKRKRPDQ